MNRFDMKGQDKFVPRSRFKEVYEWRSIFWQMTILKNVKVSKQCRKYGEKIKKKKSKIWNSKKFLWFFSRMTKKNTTKKWNKNTKLFQTIKNYISPNFNRMGRPHTTYRNYDIWKCFQKKSLFKGNKKLCYIHSHFTRHLPLMYKKQNSKIY